MEQSKALAALMEAGDLVRMIEDLTSPAVLPSISTDSMPGLRITLRNVRESILASHDALAGQVIQRAKVQLDSNASSGVHSINGSSIHAERARTGSPSLSSSADGTAAAMSRRDLRSSIEKIIEKSER